MRSTICNLNIILSLIFTQEQYNYAREKCISLYSRAINFEWKQVFIYTQLSVIYIFRVEKYAVCER